MKKLSKIFLTFFFLSIIQSEEIKQDEASTELGEYFLNERILPATSTEKSSQTTQSNTQSVENKYERQQEKIQKIEEQLEEEEPNYKLKNSVRYRQNLVNPFFNPLFPYVMQQTQQPTLTSVESNQNQAYPYETQTTVTQHPNPFQGQFPLMPFYDPHYHGFSPFQSFTHFNPFMMPLNPVFNSFSQQQQGAYPQQLNGENEDEVLKNITTQHDKDRLSRLSLLDQSTLSLQSGLPFNLDKKLNEEEALSQDELDYQLGRLNGLSDQELKEAQKVYNDVIVDELEQYKQEQVIPEDEEDRLDVQPNEEQTSNLPRVIQFYNTYEFK